MKKIKEMTLNGRNVKKCEMGGGRLFMKDNYRYEEVESLEALTKDCAIYIDPPIGYVPRIAFYGLKIMVNDVSLFNMSGESTPKNGEWGCNPDRSFYYNYGGGVWANTTVPYVLNAEMDVEFGNTIVVNGEVKATVTDKDFGESQGKRLRIFGIGYGGSLGIFFRSVRMFDGTTLLRDMVCARELATDKLGLYDKVSGNFFPNRSGELMAGPPTGNHY